MNLGSMGYALKGKCSGPVGGASGARKVGQAAPVRQNPRRKRGYTGQQHIAGQLHDGDHADMLLSRDNGSSVLSMDVHPGSGIERGGDPAQSRLGSSAGSMRSGLRSSAGSNYGGANVLKIDEAPMPRISESRSESHLTRPKNLDVVLGKLDDERIALQNESRGDYRHSRRHGSSNSACSSRLKTAGSMASGMTRCSSSASSMMSQAVRSSILDAELQDERKAREAAEAELAELRAQLANASKGGC